MTKKSLIFILILFNVVQSASQVSEKELIDRLFYTCKVWGYLKYHHTNITKGNIDWDSTLLISLNGIKSANSYLSFQDSLNQMVSRAGILSDYMDYWAFRGDSIKINNNLSWFDDSYLPKNIKDTLYKIKSKFKNESIYYLYFNIRQNIPLFTFDNKYAHELTYPDENKRILAVFRYWNIIQYFYHFNSKLQVSWDAKLKKYLLEVIKSKSEEEYVMAMRRLTKSIDDSKANFSSPVYDSIIGFAYAPFRVRYIENKTIITHKLSSISEIEIGDEIVEFNGIPIESYRDFYRSIAQGSNQDAIERNVNDLMVKGEKDKFNITLKKKNNSILSYGGRRDYIYFDSLYLPVYDAKPWMDTISKDGCSFGIINLTRYHPSTDYLYMLEDIWEKDAWIMDLRGHTDIDFSVFAPFIYPDTFRYKYYLRFSIQIPGEFYSLNNIVPNFKKPNFKKRIILLVNEYTQNLSEEFGISLLPRENVTIIGSTTDGSGDIDLATILLPGKINTQLPQASACNKKRETYHSVGIKPDYIIRPSISGFRNGQDEVLAFALRCSTISTTSIQKRENETIQIYPNPVIDFLTINFDTKHDINHTVELYDILGQKVLKKEIKPMDNRIDMSSYPFGIYFLKIDHISTPFKIIK